MKVFKLEPELMEQAREIAGTITIERYDDENGYTRNPRKTNLTEHDIIYNIAYGALSTINYDDETRNSEKMAQSIIENAEFTLDLFIPHSGFDTLLLPLKKIVAEWAIN